MLPSGRTLPLLHAAWFILAFIYSIRNSYMQDLNIRFLGPRSCLALRFSDALWIYLGSNSTLIPLLPTIEASDLSQL